MPSAIVATCLKQACRRAARSAPSSHSKHRPIARRQRCASAWATAKPSYPGNSGISVTLAAGMAPLGYMGAILDVDLTTCSHRTRELTQDTADRWLGGTGLGAHLLWEEQAYTADPL